jgi:hypothetical protein
MDRLGSSPRISSLAAVLALVLSLAARQGLAQDPMLVARVTCERAEGSGCAPSRPAPNVTELRDWQVGYFRRGAGAQVVAAFDVSNNRTFWQFLAAWGTTTLGGPPPGEWTGGVFALPDEDSGDSAADWGSAFVSGAPRAKWIGAVSAPWEALLLGLELVAPQDPAAPIAMVRNGAVGRAKLRVAPPPQPVQRLQISDILLYEHDGGPVPRGLDGPRGAGTRALGSTTLGGRQRIGLYWEVYGLATGEEARVELTIAPVIGPSSSGNASPVGIAWDTRAVPSEAAEGAWTQGFILDVGTLEPGLHRMLVSIAVPGEEAVTVAREIRVVVGG